MNADLILKNGKVVREKGIVEADILIENGKILDLKKTGGKAEEKIDCKGKLILPGLIDPHVHFREPGQIHKEDFSTGSMSAAFGGVTTVLDMPNNSPFIDTKRRFIGKKELVEKKSCVDFGLFFGISTYGKDEINEVDPIGYKFYTAEEELAPLPELQYAMNQVENKIFAVHPEDPEIIEREDRGTPLAEYSAIKKVLELDSGTNKIHFCHVTSSKSVELSGDATCEVTPHHLFLDKKFAKENAGFGKVHPPLRKKLEIDSLWNSLNKVDSLATDHAPHTIEEKKDENPPPGFPGVETLLPLMADAVSEGRLTWEELVRLLTGGAEIYGLEKKGKIKEGFDADFAILDRKKEWEIKADKLHSKCGWTPYEGRKVKGKLEKTILRGKVIVEQREFFGRKGFGGYLK
ncbi:MAG: dihydroorotase family protein [Candidatus Undinarchaeales archaeon]